MDQSTGCKGDNDPIDVLEIGYRIAKRGDVVQVKILGTVALIDEGETDWKVITIDVNDPLADQLNDIADVEKVFPGLLKATIEWFKVHLIKYHFVYIFIVNFPYTDLQNSRWQARKSVRF